MADTLVTVHLLKAYGNVAATAQVALPVEVATKLVSDGIARIAGGVVHEEPVTASPVRKGAMSKAVLKGG